MHSKRLPSRHSIRLPNCNYRINGYYFVTVCCHDRNPFFGEIKYGIMRPNVIGHVISNHWEDHLKQARHARLDTFVLMPDHVHAIIEITNCVMNRAPTALGEIVRQIKARCTYTIRQHAVYADMRIWQRNYYERIIRDDVELQNVRQYIHNNPSQWWEKYNKHNP